MLTTFQMALRVYAVVFANPVAVVRNPGKPLVIYVAFLIFANLGVLLSFIPTSLKGISDAAVSWLSPAFLASHLLIWITAVWVAAQAARCWHRHVLMRDASRESAPRPDGYGRAYLWKLALLLCPGILASIVIWGGLNAMLIPPWVEQFPNRFAVALVTGHVVILLVFGFVLGRVGLILPAAAVGRPIDFVEAWNRSRSVGWWHVGLILLVNLPIQAFAAARPSLSIWLYPLLVETIGYGLLGPLITLVGGLIGVAILCLTIAVTAVALSFNYQGVFEAPPDNSGLAPAVSNATD